MLPDEHLEILVNSLPIINEQAMAEKLAEVISVVLPKIIQRETTKLYLQKEKFKKSCEK